MNKLALLPLLMLPACASPGENARLAQAALDHDQAACVARGYQVSTNDYTRCIASLGHKEGYRVTKGDDGNIAFVLPGEGGAPAERTFYPGVYVPSVYSQR